MTLKEFSKRNQLYASYDARSEHYEFPSHARRGQELNQLQPNCVVA